VSHRGTILAFVPLRIGIFAPYDLARAGGVTNQIRSQARALRALGHAVRVFGPASGPVPDNEVAICRSLSLTVSGTESGLGLDPTSAWRLARVFRTEPFDIVHVHEPLTPVMPWFALRLARAPVVGTFHVHREHGHVFYPRARLLLAPLMRRLAYRIAVSDAARRTVADHFPGDYDIVPNGIDVDEFRAPRPRPAALVTDRLHVLYVGRLEPRKGVDTLIRAMATVQRRLPQARLLVVGDGPDREALMALARKLAVDVAFAGRVDDDVLPAYFQGSEVVCSPALGGESFGIVLLEAMACGVPIVASRIEGYVGLAGPADCGPLVPPGDAPALAAALLPLLADATIRRAVGARGAAAARQYDWQGLAARLVAIYNRLQHTRPAG
jgi:phosphatidylinositol alpha-mannosyltransferase